MNSRHLLLLMASLSAAAPAVHAAYPEKPIRIIVPYPPGGNIDITARAIAPGLTEALGQQVVIDNRGGAGGTIGSEIAAKLVNQAYPALMLVPSPASFCPPPRRATSCSRCMAR